MSNRFATAPELAPEFPPNIAWDSMWTCPITGLVVPKHPDRNLAWRADMLEAAENDEDLQQDLYTAASQSILFFINAFAFTLRVFESDDSGEAKQAKHKHIPMVTWPIQDDHCLWIENNIEAGQSGLTDKSRDMGATWDHIIVYAHRFLFRASESHLMISRKEDAVDILDGQPKNYPYGPLADPGTLFGKIDYVLSFLPAWMLPKMNRKKLHLVNLSNGTRIDGESANATAGSSDRRTSIFLDEMAKMKEGESIKRSTRDVTACRLVCSTPNGAGTAYSKWRLSGQIPVFILPWWDHPEKGAGRYIIKDEITGRFQIRSPWYDHECLIRSPKELAIEVDMDHIGSGDTFFEEVILEEHRRKYGRDCLRRIGLNFRTDVSDDAMRKAIKTKNLETVAVSPKGPWRLWSKLHNGRPDQSKTYIFGIDISKGQGASNSVISVFCVETREKVAEFADPNTPPYMLARMACAAALWFGGARKGRPFIIWENNGDPGFDFGKQIVHVCHYPEIYFARVAGTLAEKRGKRYGWRSDQEQKASALGMLRRAYAHGGFINHSHESLDEAKTYIHYEAGGIGPAELVQETESARKTHGDRVIADMLCVVALRELPSAKAKNTRPPTYSIGGRKKIWAQEQRSRNRRRAESFDFRN